MNNILHINFIGLLFLFSINVYAQETFYEKEASRLEKEYQILITETKKLYRERETEPNNQENKIHAVKLLMLLQEVMGESESRLATQVFLREKTATAKDIEKRLSMLVLGTRALENSIDASNMYINYGEKLFGKIQDEEFTIATDIYNTMTK